MEKLVAQALGGDKAAEAELIRYLRVRFKSLAERYIRDGESAEDIAQEACLTILEKYKSQKFKKGFDAWAYKVLRNKIGNHLSTQSVRQKYISSEANPDRTHILSFSQPDSALKTRIRDCMKKIIRKNPRYARVLNMMYQGYKTTEVCLKLKITSNNLYVTLKRSRMMMKTCIENGGL
ncbi:MAG: RNA polymerase sigma factor [candidate division Zixibacteria bacterium]|nr:RNA polymerase sigma factor [candidate division Zixibacteria bacterium]